MTFSAHVTQTMRFTFGILISIHAFVFLREQVRFQPRIGQFIDAESDRQTHSLQGTPVTPQRCTLPHLYCSDEKYETGILITDLRLFLLISFKLQLNQCYSSFPLMFL